MAAVSCMRRKPDHPSVASPAAWMLLRKEEKMSRKLIVTAIGLLLVVVVIALSGGFGPGV
jgi:hypothetical protein